MYFNYIILYFVNAFLFKYNKGTYPSIYLIKIQSQCRITNNCYVKQIFDQKTVLDLKIELAGIVNRQGYLQIVCVLI